MQLDGDVIRAFRLPFAAAACLVLVAGGCSSSKPTTTASKPGVQSPAMASVEPVSSLPKLPTDGQSRIARSALREHAIDVLVDFAAKGDAQQRANALEALIPTPARLEPQAAAGLVDLSPAVRSTAALASAKAKLKNLGPQIRPLLNDTSPFCRASAMGALAQLGEEVDLTPLGVMLLGDPSLRVRSHAAFVLGEIGNPSALPLLREAGDASVPRNQEAESKLFQLQLAEARAKLGDTTPLEGVKAALYPATPQELEGTALAIQILGQLRDKPSKDSILWLIEGRSKDGKLSMPAEVRLAGAAALARMGLQKGAQSLADEYSQDPSPIVRAQVATVYAQANAREREALLSEWLETAEPNVRIASASALLMIEN